MKTFITKTFMLLNGSRDNIISWNASGSSFIIWDPDKFARYLLPEKFEHTSFTKFVDQLTSYGFRKISSDRWEFAHEFFRRGNLYLLGGIKREKRSSATALTGIKRGKCSSTTALAGIKRPKSSSATAFAGIKHGESSSATSLAETEAHGTTNKAVNSSDEPAVSNYGPERGACQNVYPVEEDDLSLHL